MTIPDFLGHGFINCRLLMITNFVNFQEAEKGLSR
jgi:hypothetical protein